MSGKSKTAEKSNRAGQAKKDQDEVRAASKLVAIAPFPGDGHRYVFDGQGKTACGVEAVHGWQYGEAEDVTCGDCRSE